MPTVQQLPPATTVNPTDEFMLDQSGTSVAATVAQLLSAGSAAITLTGDVTGAGTGTILTTIAPVTAPGTFSKVTVNAKGQVTGGGAVAAADVVNALGFTPYNAANPAGYVASSALAPVALTGAFSSLTGAPTIGTLGSQNANAVAITGGAISGVDLSGAPVTATGSTTARTLAARANDVVNVLDFGADPTGAADSSPAFLAAMSAVPSGTWGKVLVPKGSYRLGSFINQPSGRSIAVVLAEGATTTGGGLGVDRVESAQGPFSLWQGGGGWFGFAPTVGSSINLGFHTDIVENNSSNSGSMRVAWAKTYENVNYYGKYASGIDIAEQNIFSWPYIYDNSSGWGHWEVITGPTWDEDSGARAHISASSEHSEFDIVNNGPESGWTYQSGQGTPVQGMSMDPWGQNGPWGGNILYSYGAVGSFDGQTGGLNNRWASYPAVFSNGNPAAVAQNSTIVITFDLTAHATATLSGGGGVSGLSITSGGGAYTSAPTVVFSGGGGGSGAVASPIMLGGSVVGATITSPGTGYTSPPTVSFTGGGIASPSATTVTLNADAVHGDLGSVAAAINAAGIPNVHAAESVWGGVINRLVIFGTAVSDLGTLTLGGTALGTLGINASSYTTQRDTMVVVFGNTSGCSIGDQLTINNTAITVGGTGAQSDVINAINGANLLGIRADSNANGNLVVTAWIPQNPGGLILAEPSGYTTLTKLGLTAGTFWPPTPPKGFATATGELSSPICPTTDQLSISATDLAGNTYGPITVTLNGGAGTGWPADVAASIQGAMITAGWANNGPAQMLSAPPAIAIAYTHGSGGNQGLVVRNTAGGTLTFANVTGTPLQILGVTPGTYRPGGYSAGSQSVFMASTNSIAPQGRGVFIGGASTPTDRVVWPHAPLEARGSFLHGLRTDKATFDDNNAVLLGAGQAIAFGTGSGSVTLTNVGGSLEVNGTPVAISGAVPTRVSQLTNDSNFITSVALPSGAGELLGATATAGAATTIALGANLTLAAGTLSAGGVVSFNGRNGVVALSSADVTGALGYSPGSTGGTVGSVVAGAGLAGGTITTTGTVSLAGIAAGSLMGNAGTLSAVPGAIAIGSGVSLSAAGTLSNSGVVSLNSRTGAVSLGSTDVTGALGYTPANKAGDTFSGAVTLGAGGALSGTLTNSGTISGGTLAGTVSITGTATATTQALGDNSTKLATTGYVYQATASAATVSTTGGSTTLAAAQYGVPVIIANGTLTSNATFVVPNNGVWTVANRTSGAFTLTVKTASGTGVVVDQGYSAEVIADGSNVVLSTSDFNGITLQGTITNAGTLTGGTLAGTVTASGTLNIAGIGTAATQSAGDNSTKLATTAYVYQATTAVATVSTTGGSTTLTAAQYGSVLLIASGTLTSNATFVVPTTGDWTISNRTSGAFTLTVKTSAGTGIVVDQGSNTEVVADGTNVVLARTDFNAITLQGAVTNSGNISGGTLSPTVLVAGNAGSMVTAQQLGDNAGYQPVVFKASGTNGNVPLVFAPAGAGYVATALSDGTTANGNQRGQYSVDLQQLRTANTQVASGAYAVVPGGAANTAGGSYSFAAGQGSTATGQGSVAIGQYASDGGAYGKLVFSSNANTIGNQWGVTTLFVSSVTAATRLTADGGAAGAENSIPIRSNHVIGGTLTVTARNVSTGDGAVWSIPVLFKNSAGTVSVTNPGTSAISPTASDSSLSTATVTIGADNTNKGLSITLTPPASTTVSASAVFLATEM